MNAQNDNPYQPPEGTEPTLDEDEYSDCWHDRDQLVVRHGAKLPCLCVKCGRVGQPGRPQTIVFHHSIFEQIFVGVLVGAPLCLLVLFLWPLSIHIGFALILILVCLLGWFAYVRSTQAPPDRIELLFSFCGFHRRFQYGHAIGRFAGVTLLALLVASKQVRPDLELPVVWIYVLGLAILIGLGRLCFVPVGVKQIGSKYYIRGFGKAFLRSLPAVRSR